MGRKLKRLPYTIGVDLGGTKVLICLFNRACKVLATIKTKTGIERGEKYFIDTLAKSIHGVMDEAEVQFEHLVGIGVGSPGIIDIKLGTVISSPNIPFLKNYPLREKLRKLFRVPIWVENDVNAGLYGEYQFGAGRGHRDIVGVFPGTGIGGALILQGKLYRGAFGAAGEIGHMIVDPRGPLCGCGNRGCLEAFAGRLAISSEAALLALRQQAPKLFKLTGADLSQIKSGTLRKAIKAGDRVIKKLVCTKAKLIGMVMANIANLLNPELFVLGGGLVEAMPEIFLKQTREAIKNYAMKPVSKQVKIAVARLGDFAIVKGASKMALEFSVGNKNW